VLLVGKTGDKLPINDDKLATLMLGQPSASVIKWCSTNYSQLMVRAPVDHSRMDKPLTIIKLLHQSGDS